MKNKNQISISTYIALIISGAIFISTLIFFCLSLPALAQSVRLQIPIGDKKDITVCSGGLCHGIALYIVEFAKWFVGAITMLAVLAIMFGGIIWLTSRAEQKQVAFAKKLIQDSLIGLGIVLGSFLFLSMISPDLVNFKAVSIEEIDNIEGDTPNISEISNSGGGCSDVATAADVRTYSHPNITGPEAHGKLCKDTATALEKAADICQKKYGQSIPIGDAWRSLQDQERLFRTLGPSRACNPHKYPGKVTCPHTWGNAIDLKMQLLNNAQYQKVAECMKEAGWCRLTGGRPCESWHYEYPRRSVTSCIFDFDPSFRQPKGVCER